MEANQIVWAGFLASACASLGTALGSLGVLLIKQLSRRLEDGLFIISDEIIPETHRNVETFSLLVGFVVMMILDVLLG